MDLRILLILSLFGTIIPPGSTDGPKGWFRRAQEHHREKICGGPKTPQAAANPLLVETENGKVSGVQGVSRGGKEFVQFLGIPFGQPPVGKLRFEVSFLNTRLKIMLPFKNKCALNSKFKETLRNPM